MKRSLQSRGKGEALIELQNNAPPARPCPSPAQLKTPHSALVFDAEGYVDCKLQYGSDGDVERGDGARHDHSHPLKCKLVADVTSPLKFDGIFMWTIARSINRNSYDIIGAEWLPKYAQTEICTHLHSLPPAPPPAIRRARTHMT